MLSLPANVVPLCVLTTTIASFFFFLIKRRRPLPQPLSIPTTSTKVVAAAAAFVPPQQPYLRWDTRKKRVERRRGSISKLGCQMDGIRAFCLCNLEITYDIILEKQSRDYIHEIIFFNAFIAISRFQTRNNLEMQSLDYIHVIIL
jgi:hypothetical protein